MFEIPSNQRCWHNYAFTRFDRTWIRRVGRSEMLKNHQLCRPQNFAGVWLIPLSVGVNLSMATDRGIKKGRSLWAPGGRGDFAGQIPRCRVHLGLPSSWRTAVYYFCFVVYFLREFDQPDNLWKTNHVKQLVFNQQNASNLKHVIQKSSCESNGLLTDSKIPSHYTLIGMS